MRRGLAIIAAIASVAILFAWPAAADIAIALNTASGKAAAYNGSWDAAQVARREALSRCGGGCRIVLQAKKTCGAVVEAISTGGSVWAVATGSTTSGAANSAWHECRRKGGVTCKTAASVCE